MSSPFSFRHLSGAGRFDRTFPRTLLPTIASSKYFQMDFIVGQKTVQSFEGTDAQVHSNALLKSVTLSSYSTYKECLITGSVLKGCKILKATVIDTVLEDCILFLCNVQGCQLKNSHIDSSRVFESKSINSLRSRCEVRPAPPFNCIPPEVRAMILPLAIAWNGKTPPLLAALRGDSVLYREALAVFRSNCTFRLHNANWASRSAMSQSTIQSIHKLHIKYVSSWPRNE